MKIEEAVVARIKKEGKHFEVLVDCDKAMEYKKGGSVDIQDVIVVENIFTDAKKGTKASEHELVNLFGTDNSLEVAGIIIKEGDVAVNAEYLRKEREVKRKQIVNLIASNSINPKTGLPHPSQRIEFSLDEAKVKIDEHKTAEAQIKEVISKLNKILPIKYGTIKLEVKIPSQYAAKSHHAIRQYGNVVKESWESDGSLKCVIEVPLGMMEKFEISLNGFTKGEAQTKKLE